MEERKKGCQYNPDNRLFIIFCQVYDLDSISFVSGNWIKSIDDGNYFERIVDKAKEENRMNLLSIKFEIHKIESIN